MLIYKITNSVNNKTYIGQTICLLNIRIKQHLNCVKDKKNHLLGDNI